MVTVPAAGAAVPVEPPVSAVIVPRSKTSCTNPFDSLLQTTADNSAAFKVFKRDWPADDQPFQAERAPIALQTKARRIPNWTLDAKGAINEVVETTYAVCTEKGPETLRCEALLEGKPED